MWDARDPSCGERRWAAVKARSKTAQWLAEARAHADAKHYEDALAYCGRVLAVDRENTQALVLKGRALWRLGRYDEADEAFDRLLAIEPVEKLPGRVAEIEKRSIVRYEQKAFAGTDLEAGKRRGLGRRPRSSGGGRPGSCANCRTSPARRPPAHVRKTRVRPGRVQRPRGRIPPASLRRGDRAGYGCGNR